MAVELEIRLEGEAPGLAEGRLSLGAFGPSLERLLEALRRIASGVVREARDPGYYGVRGGRYAKEAKLLDVQLESVEEGSLKLALILALQTASGQGNLFEDLPERTARVFVQAVDAEGHGRLQNAMVRRYLSSLPEGVTAQSYRATRDGDALVEAQLGRVTLTDETGELPALLQDEAIITGVGFPPAKSEVRFRLGHQTIRCEATREQVDTAIALRSRTAEEAGSAPVRGSITAVVLGKAGRLVSIRDPRGEPRTLTDEARTEALFARWDRLLRRLAR